MLRILIADDHEVARRGIRALLEGHPGWEVCAEAKDGREAVELAGTMNPDLILLDIGMPVLNGLEAARKILAASPDAVVLILTMHDTDQVVREVLRAGVRGFLLKSDAGATWWQQSRHCYGRVHSLRPELARWYWTAFWIGQNGENQPPRRMMCSLCGNAR